MLLLIDNGSKHTPELIAYFKKRKIKYIIAHPDSSLKSLMEHKFKGVIMSGGPLLYDEAVDIEEVDIDLAVLLDLNVPTLGICFGHQTIAEAFDGRMKKLPAKVEKNETIVIVKSNKLFKGVPKEFQAQEFHTDCVSELPYNFDLVARSDSCGVESMKHKSKEIYGVQFHPEASGEIGEQILDNFIKICDIK
ncbi:TPA: gamma-glutamyl-gamma-aminobutyrate hydrolase family protein [archaeon]|jgi:GMP synthase (glutamine-hydrolysing)|uniref:Gamma-glutamyl-gamma-aminobutyrate hydrolase family protein n=1 Tax=Candidatus Undinarchaeum marinum TaxID=2756141 RepID=A0A832V009_9ARCH|nr:gamma-glutamyl-gamma-aminobutyrate hydrolase family protein [Candidatus Undinarchaeum marinum]